jgi:hypothetical protein
LGPEIRVGRSELTDYGKGKGEELGVAQRTLGPRHRERRDIAVWAEDWRERTGLYGRSENLPGEDARV